MYKFIKLRRRYIFTKADTLRLRYIALTSVCVFCALFVSLQTVSIGQGLDVARAGKNFSQMGFPLFAAKTPHADATPVDVLKSGVSDGIRKAAVSIKKPLLPLHETIAVGEGQTVAGVMQAQGVGGSDAYYAVKALDKYFDVRKIRPGQSIDLYFSRSEDEKSRNFERLEVRISPVKTVQVSKTESENFTASVEEATLVRRTYAKAAEIQSSVYGSAEQAGIPAKVVANVIRTYSWNVDFQRDIRAGDSIEVLYEADETEDGEYSEVGNILFASLRTGGKTIPIYRYESRDGEVDYYEPNGYTIKKMLMKTPIDGARISSGFGMRHHPVLGYNKMHKGMDFAAPTGTPIYAAGNGVIDYAGRKGGYGNYIRIRHNSKIKTAYAHMSRLAKGMKKGGRVKQGDIIGYVGTTGRSTGPHLHYEVLLNDQQVNPRSVKLPTGQQLEGEDLKRFKRYVSSLDQKYAALTRGIKVAAMGGEAGSDHIQ